MEALSTSVNAGEKLKEEAARLESEVRTLREQLAAAASTTQASSNGAHAELLELRSRVQEEREARERERLDSEKRIANIQEQKDDADAQYKSLLGRVSTIRTTLGERMKADAVSLAHPLCRTGSHTPHRKSWRKRNRPSRSSRTIIGPCMTILRSSATISRSFGMKRTTRPRSCQHCGIV